MFEFVEESKHQRKGLANPGSPLNICGNVIRQISPSCCWTLIRLDLRGLSHLTQAHQHTPPPITSSIKDINIIKIYFYCSVEGSLVTPLGGIKSSHLRQHNVNAEFKRYSYMY